MIKQSVNLVGDYLFGIKSYRDARYFEGFAREYLPKRDEFDLGDLISLERALENVNARKNWRFHRQD